MAHMRIPRKITPCPIAEAVFEIRFQPDMPGDAIFGLIYNEFKDQYPSNSKLPILQLPEAIRSQDPQLKFNPHYKMQRDNFLLQIGPNVFSIVNAKEYSGWEFFSKKIIDIVGKISKIKLTKCVNRIGLRYINIFENLDIYEKSNMKLLLKDNQMDLTSADLTATIQSGDRLCNFKMANMIQAIIEGKISKGSIIDIDVSYEEPVKDFNRISEIIEQSHIVEKDLFFSFLRDDFLQSLNPEY